MSDATMSKLINMPQKTEPFKTNLSFSNFAYIIKPDILIAGFAVAALDRRVVFCKKNGIRLGIKVSVIQKH